MNTPRLFCRLSAAVALLLSPLSLPAQAPPEVQVIRIEEERVEATPPETMEVKDQEKLPDDIWAMGVFGDTLLRNSLASMVFGQMEEGAAERKGALLDIYSSPSAPENFREFRPIIGNSSPKSIRGEKMESYLSDDGETATVAIRQYDASTPAIIMNTTYEMRSDWPGAYVTTIFTNEDDETVTLPSIGDYVGWGFMGIFVPSRGWIKGGAGTISDVEFIFARLYDSLVFIYPDLETGEWASVKNTMGASRIIYKENITLDPGESVEIGRWLLTGQKDPSKLLSFVMEQKGEDSFGVFGGRIVERDKLPDGKVTEVADVPGSEVRVSPWVRKGMPDSYIGKPYIYGISDESGLFLMNLPVGEYRVDSAHPARLYTPQPTTIKVRPGKTSALDYGVSPASGVQYEVVDQETGELLPAKLSFLPLRGGSNPDFGPPGALQSFNTIYTASGRGVQDVPPGDYRVVASHGVEYNTVEKRVRIQKLKRETLKFELTRAYDTDGWISADLGIRTKASDQARLSDEVRVISAAAEGLDWIVTADTNTVTDLTPAIQQTNLTNHLACTPGMRISSTADKLRGDFTIFPASACAAGEATDFSPLFETSTPAELIDTMRTLCPAAFMIANRPIFPTYGVLGLLGYDAATGEMPTDIDLLADLDAVQIWEGKRQSVVAPTITAYEALLSYGFFLSPIGNSLSTGTFNEEPGYPRVFIQSSSDDPNELNEDELIENLRAGRVMVTNGPFIDFRINGAGPGEMISDDDGIVEVELDVYSPNWANVGSVTITQNGRMIRQILLPGGELSARGNHVFPPPDKPENGKFNLRIREDCVMTVRVQGDPAVNQDPVNPFNVPTRSAEYQQGQVSLAYSAPIMIDVDGNGRLDITPDLKTEELPSVPAF